MLHVAVVPERLEDPVSQTEDEDVLDRLLSEVVIDAVDLPLGKDRVHEGVQLARALEVAPERLLDDDARPGDRVVVPERAPGEPSGADVPDEGGVLGGRRGEVEDPVAGNTALLLHLREELSQRAEGGVILEDPGLIEERARETFPLRRGSARALDRVLHLFAELLVRPFPPREADDRRLRVEELLLREAEERGDELPVRQVSARAEDHEGAGIGRLERDALLAERIPPGLRGDRKDGPSAHAVFTG